MFLVTENQHVLPEIIAMPQVILLSMSNKATVKHPGKNVAPYILFWNGESLFLARPEKT